MRLARCLCISNKVGSDMCHWLITDTVKLLSKTSVYNVTRYDYLKLDTESRVDDFNKKLTDPLDDGNIQINSDVDGDFDFILPEEYLRKNLGVNYASRIAPTDW